MRGLKYRKLDLHIHTPASADFVRPDSTSDEQLATAIVDQAIKMGLDAIAVTDHNSGEWVDLVKKAAVPKSLVVFPGVEITTEAGAGVHIIALFDPTKGSVHVRDLLSKLGLKPEDHGKEKTVVQKSPSEVMVIISQCGALAVAAHINSSHGVFKEMSGQSRTQVIQHPSLRAVEATDYTDEEKKKTRKRAVDLLDGSDPEYKRTIAVIQSSDNPGLPGKGGHSIAGIGSRFTCFKMEKIDLLSLRNCFDDPDVRIKLGATEVGVYPRVKRVKVVGGFLDGCDVEFHEGLNSVIGAKGSGKSLLVELLRFSLDQVSANESISEDHRSKLELRLRTYGTVETTMLLETGKEIACKRKYDPQNGDPFDDPSIDIGRLFPVLFLSQNEIIKIAEDDKEQLAFIDRFFDFKLHKEAIEQLERELKEFDKQYAATLKAYIQSEELKRRIATIETEIEGIDVSLKHPVFERFSKAEAKQQGLQMSVTYLNDLSTRIGPAIKYFLDVPVPAYASSVADDPSLKRSAKALADARGLVNTKLIELGDGFSEITKLVSSEEQSSLLSYGPAKAEYEEIVRNMGGTYQSIAAKRSKLVKELSELRTRFGKAKEMVDKANQINDERKKRLDSLAEAYSAFSAERKAKCHKFEEESSKKLKITLLEGSNVDVFRHKLGELKKGSYLRDADIEKICQSITPNEFVTKIISYAARRQPDRLNELATKVSLDLNSVVTLANYLLDVVEIEELLEMQYKAMPQDRPEIKYMLTDGSYAPLSSLSVGQKCTAMLIMTLSDGTMPIAIDQPEDSLDIRSIWTDVCMKLRNGKENRQFIFTTHNSSLAVASDSDSFIVMEADAHKGRVSLMGSMDHDPLGNEVINYLEGGLVTYKRKYAKYDVEGR
jgi:DNA repair ATPase RecN